MPGAIDAFKGRGSFVDLWKIRTEELYEAAALVWNGKVIRTDLPHSEVDELHLLYRPAQLLMGLCLEVALKGLIVERNPSLFDGESLPKQLKTHSLERLFDVADIALEDNDNELNFVRRLSDGVEWVARYPVPLRASHLKQPRHKSSRTLMRNDQDFDRFEALRARIMREFD